MKRKLFIFLPILIILLGFATMLVLINLKKQPERRPAVIPPRIVGARVVQLKDLPVEIVAYGRLASTQPIALVSEVSGELMRGSVTFQPAQSFKKGDLLVKIDDRQIRLDINTAKSEFLNALAAVLPELKVDFPEEFEKYQQYFDCCGFTDRFAELPETDNQRVKLFLSRFNVYRLYFAVRNLEIRLEKHDFYAPFDGSIVSADLRVGSTARVGSQLGQIINLEAMEVELPVPAIDIQWIDQQKPVLFTSSEISGTWRGRVKRIGKSIDTRTQTVQVFAGVDRENMNALYDGVFLKAQIPGTVIRQAVSISRKSVYQNNTVYLIQNGKLELRPIEISFEAPDSVIVTKGIQTGDTLVVQALQGVVPGMAAQARLASVETGARP